MNCSERSLVPQICTSIQDYELHWKVPQIGTSNKPPGLWIALKGPSSLKSVQASRIMNCTERSLKSVTSNKQPGLWISLKDPSCHNQLHFLSVSAFCSVGRTVTNVDVFFFSFGFRGLFNIFSFFLFTISPTSREQAFCTPAFFFFAFLFISRGETYPSFAPPPSHRPRQKTNKQKTKNKKTKKHQTNKIPQKARQGNLIECFLEHTISCHEPLWKTQTTFALGVKGCKLVKVALKIWLNVSSRMRYPVTSHCRRLKPLPPPAYRLG